MDEARTTWQPDCATPDFYSRISECIKSIVRYADRDPYLIRDWVWITAQFRIAHPHDHEMAKSVWGALNVFIDLISTLSRHHSEQLPAIRWIADDVIERLIEVLGPQAIDRFVSTAEQNQIDELLSDLVDSPEPDLGQLLDCADRVAQEFASIHHVAYFPAVADKLRELAKAATDNTDTARWATAALRYVYLDNDVIDDRQGYIGYLDDIQVIERLHTYVYGDSPWRSLVDHATSHWPMLSRTYWRDQETTNYLPPFLKLAAACALYAALDKPAQRIITAREVGPIGFLSATVCALCDLRAEPKPDVPAPDTVVTFRQGRSVRHAVMKEPYDAGNGTNLPMIALQDGARHIPAQYASLLEPASEQNPKLATNKQFNEWIASVEEQQLTPIWNYRRAHLRPSVLYVTDRSRFFEALGTIRPFGYRVDELLPVAYYTRGGRATIGSGAGTAAPAMMVCNDIATAERTIRLADDQSKTPRSVMIDRSADPGAISSLSHRCQQVDSEIKVITFAEPDSALELSQNNTSAAVWYIKPEDLVPTGSPQGPPTVRTVGNGPIASYIGRQIGGRTVEHFTRQVEFPELDHFAELADSIARRSHREQDDALELTAVAAEGALRRIAVRAPVQGDGRDSALQSSLDHVRTHAQMIGLYDAEAQALADAAGTLASVVDGDNPKAHELDEALRKYPDAIVLVASRVVASALNRMQQFGSRQVDTFAAVHDLDQLSDIETVIVPSWFGAKKMQSLQMGGWSRRQIRLLYRYELTRLERLNRRLDHQTRQLTEHTRNSWHEFRGRNPELEIPPPPTESHSRPPLQVREHGRQDTRTEHDSIDWIESAIRKRLAGSSAERQPRSMVAARLVFFDDAQHYGVFSTHASLVCINEIIGGHEDLAHIGEREAEELLWKPVSSLAPGDILAFPDDPDYGDVIDELADALIGDDGRTRRSAGLWRRAVRIVADRHDWDLDEMKAELAIAGVKRETSTLASWLYSTKTVAPKRPDITIPQLLQCAAEPELQARESEILDAAATVYGARRRAGRVLVAQLSTASIRPESGDALVEIKNSTVKYRLLTVATVDEAAQYQPAALGLHEVEV